MEGGAGLLDPLGWVWDGLSDLLHKRFPQGFGNKLLPAPKAFGSSIAESNAKAETISTTEPSATTKPTSERPHLSDCQSEGGVGDTCKGSSSGILDTSAECPRESAGPDASVNADASLASMRTLQYEKETGMENGTRILIGVTIDLYTISQQRDVADRHIKEDLTRTLQVSMAPAAWF